MDLEGMSPEAQAFLKKDFPALMRAGHDTALADDIITPLYQSYQQYYQRKNRQYLKDGRELCDPESYAESLSAITHFILSKGGMIAENTPSMLDDTTIIAPLDDGRAGYSCSAKGLDTLLICITSALILNADYSLAEEMFDAVLSKFVLTEKDEIFLIEWPRL